MSDTMTSFDLVTGIFAALALRDELVIDAGDTRFDKAMASVYDELIARDLDLDIDFQIIPDQVHRDSTVVQDAVMEAIESRVVSRLNPSFRRLQIELDDAWATSVIDELPGGGDLYRELVDCFLAHYKQAEPSVSGI